MKKAALIHNPEAGNGTLTASSLVAQVRAAGFDCAYASTKDEGWEKTIDKGDFIIIAGGDGTVRKIASLLMNRPKKDRRPIALLPLGTANNVGKTLGVKTDPAKLASLWPAKEPTPYDAGIVKGLDESAFFLEGFGYGCFPNMMNQMKHRDEPVPELALKLAVRLMHEITLSYVPRKCELIANGKDLSGKYLMLEILNAPSLGPNLLLAPDANVSDGCIEILAVPKGERDTLARWLAARITGSVVPLEIPVIKASSVQLAWDGIHGHIDDKIVKEKRSVSVSIEVEKGALQFLVP